MAKKPIIVAIDDEQEFINMFNDYFELRGYEIHTAIKGVKGIELIKEKKPDIVILDLKMPGISGDEVLGLSKRVQPKAQVIFVTAYNDGGKTKAKMLDAGAYDYLDKPIPSLKGLEETILKAYSQGSKTYN